MEILLNKAGKKTILLGDEAIVRGALETGVSFVATYPGTPASEIGNLFFSLKDKTKICFEWSVNEKIALEAAIGASFSGLKTLVAMKNFGLNVCLDALGPFLYTGTKGPAVIVVADDPSCHSSAQWEENTRAISYLTHLPTLEPSDPQECLDFTKLSFQISERFKIPVMIRITTRVGHQRALVTFGKIQDSKSKIQKNKFIKDPKRFVTLPPRVLEMKKELLRKIRKIKEFFEKSKINRIENWQLKIGDFGIITSGISYLYLKEVLNELKLSFPILKLGSFYPLPTKKIKNFIKNFKKILLVEELEPYLEREIKRFAKEINPKLQIFGKNLIPEVGELKPEIILSAIAKFTNCQLKIENWQLKTFQRFPCLCPGCPYQLVISAVKKAVNLKEVIFGGDIGCYMLFAMPTITMQDYLSCMGSSIGIAHGIKKTTDQKLITFIGDSTFFHAGIPALINTIFNKSNPLIIVLNNQTTAMTGHQPHPGVNGIKIEDICRACGVENLKVIDSINQKELIKTIKEFLNKRKVSVIITKRPCIQIKK